MRIPKVLVIMLLLCLFPGIVTADFPDDDFNDDEINAAIGFQGWFTQADAKWRISFPQTTGAGASGKIESELTFEHIDSPIMIVTGEGRLDRNVSFDAMTSVNSRSMGAGSIGNGRGSDTDRFIPDGAAGFDFSESRNKTTGAVKLWGINVYYKTNRLGAADESAWGLVVGFLHYEDKLRMTQGVQTLSRTFNGIDFPPAGTSLTGLDSTYNFRWNLLRVGILRKAELVRRCSYSAGLSLYPLVDYRGEGFWNLRAGTGRDDFRLKPPNFIQQATMGYGYDASLGLIYHFSEKAALSAGYRYFFLYAGKGTDTTYFADGSSFRDRLDWVTVTRHGAFTELLLKF